MGRTYYNFLLFHSNIILEKMFVYLPKSEAAKHEIIQWQKTNTIIS